MVHFGLRLFSEIAKKNLQRKSCNPYGIHIIQQNICIFNISVSIKLSDNRIEITILK